MTEIIRYINTLDTNLFLAINGCHSPYFDGFWYIFSDKFTWIAFYLSVLYVVIRQYKKQAYWVVGSLLLCILLADQISSGIIKDWVQRPRPSQSPELDGLVHLVNQYRGGRFGFVSSHAANSFGFALLTSLLFRNRTYSMLIFVWAIFTTYSRIYLGVHFPLDLLGGALVGLSSALFCYRLLIKFRPAIQTFTLRSDTLLLPKVVMVASCIVVAFLGLF